MVDIHSATAEIRPGKKKRRKKKDRRNHRAKYNGLPYSLFLTKTELRRRNGSGNSCGGREEESIYGGKNLCSR